MVWLLYYILIYLLVGGIRFSCLWSEKSRNWIEGRRDWKKKLKMPPKGGPRIWFHVSSLGEFEQARPVIEKLKSRNKEIEIILTFFSPSGYLIRSGYSMANVQYLPADLPGNARAWIDIVRPDLAVFVKYDLWPGYLKALDDQAIPAILFSAHWTPGAFFASHNIAPTRALLRKFRQIFLQQGDDLAHFRSKGFTNLSAAGDTRIDRSLELPKEAASRIPDFLKEAETFDLVAGSTWPGDEKLIREAIDQLNLRAIVAPHDVSESNIRRLLESFPSSVTRLSEMKDAGTSPNVVIVDSIGLLNVLYPLGKIAYVGGGFGSGIHNTLEPMAHGKPILFGPAFTKFPEAVEMVRLKAAIPVRDTQTLVKAILHFKEPGESENAGKISLEYLLKNSGASDKVTNYIMESIPCSAKS
jgi:3-deoxy-D-manno-octulosonic-acid transferase